MKVKNNTTITLGLPVAGPVESGGSTEIPDSVAQNAVVSAWISKGMLEVISGGNAAPDAQTDAESEPAQSDDKDALIAELAELGITRDKRTSVANLRKTLDDARADQADDDDA